MKGIVVESEREVDDRRDVYQQRLAARFHRCREIVAKIIEESERDFLDIVEQEELDKSEAQPPIPSA